ncbi:MAG: hypothetical protein AAF565_17690, partial [Pseudomonadota bacterium]
MIRTSPKSPVPTLILPVLPVLPVLPALAAWVAAIAFLLAAPSAVAAQEGYYYPEVGSEEMFERKLTQVPRAPSRDVRVSFVTQITKAQLDAPETPRYAIFAKGAEAEHMIIVALDDEVFRT